MYALKNKSQYNERGMVASSLLGLFDSYAGIVCPNVLDVMTVLFSTVEGESSTCSVSI